MFLNGPLRCLWSNQIDHIEWSCLIKLAILIWLVNLLVMPIKVTCPQVPCVTQKGSKELDLQKWLETWCRSQLLTLKGVEGSCWKLRD